MKTENIKILWLRSDGLSRISYEMQAGDMIAASRIFAEMIRILTDDNKNLGASLPHVGRKEQG